MYCKNCGSPLPDNVDICINCGFEADKGRHYCQNCGRQVNEGAAICTNCGTVLNNISSAPAAAPEQTERKSKIIAGLLGIFLGSLGIHNFYLGFTKKATVQLIVTVIGGFFTCGLSGLIVGSIAFVESVLILAGVISVDANGIPLK